MKEKNRKRLAGVFMFCLLTTLFTSLAYTAQYIYYGGGLLNPSVEVEDRLSYDIYDQCVNTWNSTSTPVNITTVPGSGHSYIISGQWDDVWYGMYTPKDRQYVFTGRAGKFKIELNRSTLVNKSDTFRSSVLVHELGHAFCLDDNPSSGDASIMNYTRNRDYLTWPTSDDIAGVNNAYN
ncbi:hypothetical protein ACR6HW_17670 [Fusibacter sp. JL298sf-3]